MTPQSPHHESSRAGDDIEELRRLSDLLQTPRPYPSAAEQTEDDWIAVQRARLRTPSSTSRPPRLA